MPLYNQQFQFMFHTKYTWTLHNVSKYTYILFANLLLLSAIVYSSQTVSTIFRLTRNRSFHLFFHSLTILPMCVRACMRACVCVCVCTYVIPWLQEPFPHPHSYVSRTKLIQPTHPTLCYYVHFNIILLCAVWLASPACQIMFAQYCRTERVFVDGQSVFEL